MAKNDKTKATAADTNDFDFAAFMPEGYDAGDLRVIGGLTPIYSPEDAFEGGFPPVVGLMDRIEILPEVKVGKEMFIPRCIRVQCLTATKATTGKKGERKSVDIAAGEDVLIPITGNLSNNKTLLAACVDAKHVYLVVARVRGQVDVGQISPMWDWDVRLHPKSQERKGRFLLPQNASRIEVLGTTSSGDIYDADGVVKERIVGANTAQAAAS